MSLSRVLVNYCFPFSLCLPTWQTVCWRSQRRASCQLNQNGLVSNPWLCLSFSPSSERGIFYRRWHHAFRCQLMVNVTLGDWVQICTSGSHMFKRVINISLHTYCVVGERPNSIAFKLVTSIEPSYLDVNTTEQNWVMYQAIIRSDK